MRILHYILLTSLLFLFSCKSESDNQKNRQSNSITLKRKNIQKDTVIEMNNSNKSVKDEQLLASFIMKKKNKTIIDYYLALPDYYFFGCKSYKGKRYWGEVTEEQRTSYIQHKNIQNGYLMASFPNETTPLQVALFTYQKKHVIAVFMDAGSMWQCTIRDFLFLDDKGSWQKLDIELPINYSDNEVKKMEDKLKENNLERPLDRKIKLPEFGTDLEVLEVFTNTLLFKIAWQTGSFVVKKE